VHGFNLGYAISLGNFEDFVHYITPERVARGRVRFRPATPLTLRDDHPASQFRKLRI